MSPALIAVSAACLLSLALHPDWPPPWRWVAVAFTAAGALAAAALSAIGVPVGPALLAVAATQIATRIVSDETSPEADRKLSRSA